MISIYFLFAGTVDLLKAVKIDQRQLGVKMTEGFCVDRAGTGIADKAFEVKAQSQLSVTTYEAFPCKCNLTMIYLHVHVSAISV